MKNYIELNDVTVRRNGKTILSQIDLTISPGKILAVLGPNGAGKSSLLELLLGDNKPSSGQIAFNFDKTHVMSSRVGVLYNNQFMFPQLFVKELFDFYKSVYKSDGVYFSELLDLFDIRRLLDSRIRNLSEGEKKKIGIALSLFHKPDFLVLDEPFANLDSVHIDTIWTEIKKLNVTAIIATHDWSYAEKYADEFLMMDCGKILGRKFASTEKHALLQSSKKVVVNKSTIIEDELNARQYYEKDEYLHILLTEDVSIQSIRRHTLNYSVLDLSMKDIFQYLSTSKTYSPL